MIIKNQSKYKEFFADFNEKISFNTFSRFFYQWYPTTKLNLILKKSGIYIDIILFQFTFKFKVTIYSKFILKYINKKTIKIFFKFFRNYAYFIFFSQMEHKSLFQFFFDAGKNYLKMKNLIFEIQKRKFFLVKETFFEKFDYPFDIKKNDLSLKVLFVDSYIYCSKTQIYTEKENYIKGLYINLNDYNFFKSNKTFFLFEKHQFPYDKISLLNNFKTTKLFFKIGKSLYIYDMDCTFKSNKIKLVKEKKDSEDFIYIPIKTVKINFLKKIPLEEVYFFKRNQMTLKT